MLSRLGITSGYLAGFSVAAVASGAVAIFVFDSYDRKFSQSPLNAFYFEVMMSAAFSVFSTLIVGIVSAIFHRKLVASSEAVVLAFWWGGSYAVGLQVLTILLEALPDAGGSVGTGIWVTFLAVVPIAMFLHVYFASMRTAVVSGKA